MADERKRNQQLMNLNITVVALVALVAIVGLTAIVLNGRNAASGTKTAAGNQNVAGQAADYELMAAYQDYGSSSSGGGCICRGADSSCCSGGCNVKNECEACGGSWSC
jgi:hypothetical protein